MQLREFLEQNGLQMVEFGEMVGTTGATICRIVNGQVPRRDLMVRIYEATRGRVTPNDLVGLPCQEHPETFLCQKSKESRS